MLFRYPFRALGSGCEILVRGEDNKFAKNAVQTALNLLQRLEAKYSYFLPESLLSRINQQAFQSWIELDEETAELLRFAQELHQASGGLFDPAIGGLKDLWDFSQMALPDEALLAKRLAGVGWDKIEFDGHRLRFLHPQTRLDLGGVAKEYAVDGCVAALAALGVQSGLVNLGGDLRAIGKAGPDSRPWTVGVADPRRHGSPRLNLSLSEGAVVTSGDYQRYFIRDGVRYHHLLNPLTGYPVQLQFSSVTAWGATAMEASAISALLMLGGRAALEKEKPSGRALVVFDTGGQLVFQQENSPCRLAQTLAQTLA